ncbi:Sensor protein evgS precursor [Rickettsiales bacterium Ac37b]|nr:Sensor protein evgS precursor [Rickettsiales bacterium Ac37b]
MILLLSFVVGWFHYSSIQQDKLAHYNEDQVRISNFIERNFYYISHFCFLAGKKIQKLPSISPKEVATILYDTFASTSVLLEVINLSIFDFTTSNGLIIANSTGTTFDPPLIINEHNRSWMKTAPEHPWTLVFSSPDAPISNVDPVKTYSIIPVGYGITNEQNKFIGTISLGINIAQLTHDIIETIDSDTSFLLLTDDFKIVASSSFYIQDVNNELAINDSYLTSIQDLSFGLLPKPIEYRNEVFDYYSKIKDYPYIILLGRSKVIVNQEFNHIVLPEMLKTIVICCFLLALLYFFSTQIVNPIMILSEKARLISTGHLNITLPKPNSIETAHVVDTLELMKSTLKQEQKLKLEVLEANAEVQKINAELEHKIEERTAQLTKALAAKTEFLNNISHEVRTPIQGITALSQGLSSHWDNFSDEEKYNLACKVTENAERLFNLIGHILDVSKFFSNKVTLAWQVVDLVPLINDIIYEFHAIYLFDKKITISFSSNVKLAIAIVDKEYIIQVFRNLLANALKFTEFGKINIKLKETVLSSNNGITLKAFQCSIQDSGIGIPDEELASIFEPFVQSSRTKTSAGGTGLGLTVSKAIIQAHDGVMWAENNKDRGVTFSFIIPTNQDKISNLKSINNEEILEDEHLQNYPMNILIIDDEEVCLMSMKIILHNSNYNITTIDKGLDALIYLESHSNEVDLILLDLMMPDISGLEIIYKIKNNPKLCNIPILLQTGVNDDTEIKKAFTAGIVDCIQKPYQRKDILNSLKKILLLKHYS